MHGIWNPWHGCVKCSEGCRHCYMYFLDRVRDQNGSYKIQSGELIRVCMSSDFFGGSGRMAR